MIDVEVFGTPGAGKTTILAGFKHPGTATVLDRGNRYRRHVVAVLHAIRSPEPRDQAALGDFLARHPQLLPAAHPAIWADSPRHHEGHWRYLLQLARRWETIHLNSRVRLWDAAWCQAAVGLLSTPDGPHENLPSFLEAAPRLAGAVVMVARPSTASLRIQKRGFRPQRLRGESEDVVLTHLASYTETALVIAEHLRSTGIPVLELEESSSMRDHVRRLTRFVAALSLEE